MANILLVDASPLIYANYNAMKRFKTKLGEPTGLRFGFMRSMRSYVEKTQADRVAICLDLPGEVKKAEGIAEYKANRTWTPEKEEMYAQVPQLMEMLSYTRYATASAKGYEADDVIAHLAKKFAKANHQVYIVTPDNDLLQVVANNVRIWMPPKKENKNKAWFKDDLYCLDHFGVPTDQLLWFRALIGDKSDNLRGAVHVRYTEKLAEFFRDEVEEDTPAKAMLHLLNYAHSPWLRDQWEKIFEQNIEIMRLHDPEPGELNIVKGRKDPDTLRKLFYDLEMKSLVAHVGKYTGIEEPGLDAAES